MTEASRMPENKLDLTIFQGDNVAAFAGRLCSRPLGTSITPLQTGGLPTFATIFNSFIDIIHSTENKAIKRYDVRKFEL